jgi:hypothetical protein
MAVVHSPEPFVPTYHTAHTVTTQQTIINMYMNVKLKKGKLVKITTIENIKKQTL